MPSLDSVHQLREIYLSTGSETLHIDLTQSTHLANTESSRVLTGIVKLGTAVRAVAVKVSRVEGDLAKQACEREAVIMRLSHERLLPVLCATREGTFRVWVTPLMASGDLLRYVSNNPVVNRWPLLSDVAEGLTYLHDDVGISHGDLRPSKILISQSGRALISGFGMSAMLEDNDLSRDLVVKSPRYAAPERHLRQSPSSDIYAFCIIIFEALTLRQISIDFLGGDIIFKMVSLEGTPLKTQDPWEVIEEELCTQLMKAWVQDPLARPTADSLRKILVRLGNEQQVKERLQDGAISDNGRVWRNLEQSAYVCSAWRRLLRQDEDEMPRGKGVSGPLSLHTGKDDAFTHEMAYAPRSEGQGPHRTQVVPFCIASVADDPSGSGVRTQDRPQRPTSREQRTIPSPPRARTTVPLPTNAAPDSPAPFLISTFMFRGQMVQITIASPEPLYVSRMNKVLVGVANIDGKNRALAVKIAQPTHVHSREMHQRELWMWQVLEHPNILPIYGSCPVNDEQSALISPLMKNGTLTAYIDNTPHADRLGLMCDVAKGVRYLHEDALVVHGDLKPTNILIDDNHHAVLADFGLSTTIRAGNEVTKEWIRSSFTIEYCAPELARDDAVYSSAPNVPRSKTTMSDVWAFGMMLYVVFGGVLPSNCWAMVADMDRGILPPPPPARHPSPSVRASVWDLCQACWCRDPDARPSIRHAGDVLEKQCVLLAFRRGP